MTTVGNIPTEKGRTVHSIRGRFNDDNSSSMFTQLAVSDGGLKENLKQQPKTLNKPCSVFYLAWLLSNLGLLIVTGPNRLGFLLNDASWIYDI
jgi:hypothetical protein